MSSYENGTHSTSGHGHGSAPHGHILPEKMILLIGGCLLTLTALTVGAAHIDLGSLNLVVALLIATTKASLVALFFMGLKYDRKENGVIFVTSFLFLAIFFSLTASDLLFRGDVYVKGPIMATVQAKSHVKKPWISTPELVAHGKEEFQVQCVSCHGPQGFGDGPAAAALNPHPRNFHSDQNWVNGRKPSQVYGTLTHGVPPSAMPSFASLPPDDRWALVHYVLSLGPTPPADTSADLAKIGVTPNMETMSGGVDKTIPVEVAMERLEVPSQMPKLEQEHAAGVAANTPGAKIYRAECLSCHGAAGQGAKVRNAGEMPKAYVVTAPFGDLGYDRFAQAVIKGLPGNLMPGHGELTTPEMKDLYSYVQSLASAR